MDRLSLLQKEKVREVKIERDSDYKIDPYYKLISIEIEIFFKSLLTENFFKSLLNLLLYCFYFMFLVLATRQMES